MKQRGAIVMLAFVLLWMTLVILYTVNGNAKEPDAGCKNEFGRVVECPSSVSGTQEPS